jgi:hypothetical protein
MAAEYSANAAQDIPANGSAVFTESPVPCNCGLVYHRDGSGLFRLINKFFRQNILQNWRRSTKYEVTFHANIAIPEGGTVEPIQIALAIDGEVDPSSIMIFTPAAVEVFGNVGSDIIVTVPYVCACSTVSVRNISTQTITMQNANITFE